MNALAPHGPLAPRSVLVVDNDPALCRLLEMAFARSGLEVLATPQAEDAAAALRAGRAAALLLDLNLGAGRSGAALLREWQDDAALVVPPCWLVTGTPDDPRAAAAADCAALQRVVAKPFGVLELVAEVAAVIAAEAADAAAKAAETKGDLGTAREQEPPREASA